MLTLSRISAAFLILAQAQAGTFVCNANCASKAASGAAILAHLPQIISLMKHSKKSTKAKKTK